MMNIEMNEYESDDEYLERVAQEERKIAKEIGSNLESLNLTDEEAITEIIYGLIEGYRQKISLEECEFDAIAQIFLGVSEYLRRACEDASVGFGEYDRVKLWKMLSWSIKQSTKRHAEITGVLTDEFEAINVIKH